jgi:hypothetical protein
MAGMVADFREAVRTLRRAPRFTAAAAFTFALGLGANVAILSLVDRMVFRPLPYGEPEELLHIHSLRQTARRNARSVSSGRDRGDASSVRAVGRRDSDVARQSGAPHD